MGRGRKSGPGRQNQVCKSLEEGPREPGEAVKLLRREWSGKGMESWMGGPDHTGLGGIWVYVLRVLESH